MNSDDRLIDCLFTDVKLERKRGSHAGALVFRPSSERFTL